MYTQPQTLRMWDTVLSADYSLEQRSPTTPFLWWQITALASSVMKASTSMALAATEKNVNEHTTTLSEIYRIVSSRRGHKVWFCFLGDHSVFSYFRLEAMSAETSSQALMQPEQEQLQYSLQRGRLFSPMRSQPLDFWFPDDFSADDYPIEPIIVDYKPGGK